MSDKYAEARDFLEEVWSRLDNEFDLAGNTVKNGVKTGGGKLGGGQFLDLYISYRNAERWNVNLAWLQDEPQTEAYLRVQLYKAYNKKVSDSECHDYDLSARDSAVEAFRKKLEQLLQGGSMN